MNVQTSAGFRFGGFVLDRNAGGLFRLSEHGTAVPLALGSRAFDVLCALVERHGDLVSKQAIMDAVWPDTAVEENADSWRISEYTSTGSIPAFFASRSTISACARG